MGFYEEFFENAAGKNLNELLKLRTELSKKYKLKGLPNLIRLFSKANNEQRRNLKDIKIKPMRSLSGVTPIAIMTKPGKCPRQAKCIYCPGGLNSYFGNVPKSYTGNEPASLRAKRNYYDAVLQIFNRLENYVLLNHNIGKCDVIIMGGTFTNFPKKYKDEFVKNIYFAFNTFSELFFVNGEINFEKFYKFFELGMDFKSKERIKKVKRNVKEAFLLKKSKRATAFRVPLPIRLA